MKYLLLFFVLLFCLNFISSLTDETRFRCDYKYSSAAKGWLKHFDVPASWFDARMRCALEGAVLASPSTPEINAEMTNFMNLTDYSGETVILEMFTGIHATIAPGDYHTVEGTPLSAIPRSWAPNEPDNKKNKEKCLTLNSFGQLADVSCDEYRPFVCYRSDSKTNDFNECETVDPEYHLDRRTNKCYKFHKIPKTFPKAYLTCSAEGGHLAIINSDVESTVLKELFAKYPEKSIEATSWKNIAMIGFTDWGNHMEWRTIHGQTLTEAGYDEFGHGSTYNPDQSCGAIIRSGQLNDMYCDRGTPFICEKSPDYDATCSLPNQ